MDKLISANTLFHFTPTSQNLVSILKNGLYARYSLEIFDAILDKEVTEISIPMACFCDIPLSQIKNHTNAYGSYAIGLTKDWGIANKVSPVHYVYPHSTTAEILKVLSDNLSKFFDIRESEVKIKDQNKNDGPQNDAEIGPFFWDELEQKTPKIKDLPTDTRNLLESHLLMQKLKYMGRLNEVQDQLAHFVRYLKPYEGKIYRNDQYSERPQNFYDEREWRFVPEKGVLNKVKVKDSYKSEFFKDLRKRRYINMKLASQVKLNFKPSDIRFIIVKKDNEIPRMVDNLHDIFKDNASYNDLRLLSTRLISLDQIVENI